MLSSYPQKMTNVATLLVVTTLGLLVNQISGHGKLTDPPNRSSIWRYGYDSAPKNYVDDENFCGGKEVQWGMFGGKCGVCGDRYDDPHPQANENTGTYGQGIIAGTYESGSVIDVEVTLTTNHMGYFNFSLCVLDDPTSYEEGEECFQALTLGDGSDAYRLTNTAESGLTVINTSVALPSGLTCERCVLRWHYNTAHDWGQCEDGTFAGGCGEQETFRSCSDIAIV